MEQLLLSDVEFFVLLKAAGVNHIPYFETTFEFGKTEIPYTVHEMVRKGILSLEKDAKLQVNKPYLQIIKAIRGYKGILVIQSGEEKKNIQYIFLSDILVLLQDNKHVNCGILVEEISIEDLKEIIDDIALSDNILECPEDLEFAQVAEDHGPCDSHIILGKKCADSTIKELVKWEFCRGRYQRYVKEVEQLTTKWLTQKEWNMEILLTRINAIREEKNHDNS